MRSRWRRGAAPRALGDSGLHAILDGRGRGQRRLARPSQGLPAARPSGRLSHIDLHEVRLDQPIQTRFRHLFGEPAGVKEGGVLSQVSREINVEALPMEIPDHLELDVSGMGIGDTLRLADLPAQEGVTYLDDPEDTVLASVQVPAVIVEPEPEEEELEEGEEGAELEEGEEAPEGEKRESRRRGPKPPAAQTQQAERLELELRLFRRCERASTLDLLFAGLGNPGGGTRGPATTRLPRRRRARAPARRCLSLEVQWPAGRSALGGACRDPEARTYMNVSGQSVGAGTAILQGRPGDLLVVHDDVDLVPVAAGRLGGGWRATTGCGRSPQRSGARIFLRLRVGVGAPRRATPARLPTTSVCVRARARLSMRSSGEPPTRVEVLARDGLEETQARYN